MNKFVDISHHDGIFLAEKVTIEATHLGVTEGHVAYSLDLIDDYGARTRLHHRAVEPKGVDLLERILKTLGVLNWEDVVGRKIFRLVSTNKGEKAKPMNHGNTIGVADLRGENIVLWPDSWTSTKKSKS